MYLHVLLAVQISIHVFGIHDCILHTTLLMYMYFTHDIICTCIYCIPQACQTEQGLTDVAAAAQQFQPKGITLSTTEVIEHSNTAYIVHVYACSVLIQFTLCACGMIR